MKHISFCLLVFLCCSCNTRKQADLIIHHAVIYTVDEQFSQAQAIAVKDGKIVAVGSDKAILDQYTALDIQDAEGHFIYPGFIDAHTHFVGYGLGLQQVELVGTTSWDEVVTRVQAFVTANRQLQTTDWIMGRGWDQNDWEEKSFPDKA